MTVDLNTFKNTMRQWVRTKVSQVPALASLDLVVANEGSAHGVDAEWLRYTTQMGDASVVGIGSAQKRRRRIGRVYIEVFGPINQGEGAVSERATLLEDILRKATESVNSPHPDIVIFEPSTFERPEGGRYCEVVTARIQVDHVS